MCKRCFAFVALVLLPLALSAQVLHSTWWTDGEFFYKAVENGEKIEFYGGNLHEGGASFSLAKGTTPGVYRRLPQSSSSKDNGYDSVVFRSFAIAGGTQDVLLFYSPKGALLQAMERFDCSAQELSEALPVLRKQLERDLNSMIEGVYYGDQNWHYCRIADGQLVRESGMTLNDTLHYSFEYELDFPAHVLSLSNGEVLMYEVTTTGLNLYQAHQVSDAYDPYWVRGRKIVSLYKRWSTTADQGRWPFASQRIMTRGMLSRYPSSILRLMRNEMFARQGYEFKSDELKAVFGKELWYQSRHDNGSVNLSDLEAVNIQLIRQIESLPESRSRVMPEGPTPTELPRQHQILQKAWSGMRDNQSIRVALELREDGLMAGWLTLMAVDSAATHQGSYLAVGTGYAPSNKCTISTYDWLGRNTGQVELLFRDDGSLEYSRPDEGYVSLLKAVPTTTQECGMLTPLSGEDRQDLTYHNFRPAVGGDSSECRVRIFTNKGNVRYEIAVDHYFGGHYEQSNMAGGSRPPMIEDGAFRLIFPDCETALQIEMFKDFVWIRNLSFPSHRNVPCREFNSAYDGFYIRDL